jgi:hypothetical protein
VDSYGQAGNVYATTVTINGPMDELLTNNTNVKVSRPPAGGYGESVNGAAGAALSSVPVAAFTDPDLHDSVGEFTATIYWGDGSSNAGTITGSNGLFQVLGGHAYTASGDFEIRVVISQAWSYTAINLLTTAVAFILAVNKTASAIALSSSWKRSETSIGVSAYGSLWPSTAREPPRPAPSRMRRL